MWLGTTDGRRLCRFPGSLGFLIIVSVGSLLVGSFTAQAVQLRGTLASLGRGYQDDDKESHFDLAQSLRFRAGDLGVDGLSLGAYLQYYGDEKDDFSNSGISRLYHAYLKYQRADVPVNARLGRFFLFRGVAVGVLDGVEAGYRFKPGWRLTAFAGMQGPLSREWETETPSDAPWFGIELRGKLPKIRGIQSAFNLSYTRQERESDLLRHLTGLSVLLKFNRRLSSLNVIHVDLANSSLRKALTRWRYTSDKFQFCIEGGVLQPYVNPYSYFSGFESENTLLRLRNTVEYHLVPRKWGAGLSTLYFATSESGFRTGPYLIFPFGRLGYHFASGNQPTNNVFWGYVNASPYPFLDLYGYAATMEYEWEEMAVSAQNTTTLNAGFRIRPPFLKRAEFGLEWQNYQTPQYDAYRRVILKFAYNFDYRLGE
jgi:hypothetical protein